MKKTRVHEAGLDPYRLARRIAHQLEVKFWRGEFWVYDNGEHRYRPISRAELRARVAAGLKKEIDNNHLTQKDAAAFVTVARINNVIAALTGHTLVQDSVEMPSWLSQDGSQVFAFRNGLVRVPSVAEDLATMSLQPHSTDWFNTVVFPFEFDAAARAPQWDEFLNEVLEADAERLAILQEMFGYCLLPGNWAQKFFLLEGQGANGKSVVLKTLEGLLGKANVSSVPLGLFGERFQLVSTIGKLANLAPEADSSDRPHIGVLKAFTAGDTITIDRKNLSPVQVQPTAKLVIAANSRPGFVDRSDGLWRRLIVIPFRVTIPEERQDRQLDEKLRAELPGIFNWALEGLQRLRRRGRFTESSVTKAALEEYRLESNPVRVFFEEYGLEATGAERFIPVADLYESYAGWAKANGFQPLNITNFGKELRKAFPLVTRGQRVFHGSRRTVYLGVDYKRGPVAVASDVDWRQAA